ncbi:hypothetical protein DL96DRAFT_1580749 [Flagelloscypha sp. PMI_526]|nr:hypothetical protein DL96DRAFT_1580749 [Flagelloscypha sp. PMI_526]
MNRRLFGLSCWGALKATTCIVSCLPPTSPIEFTPHSPLTLHQTMRLPPSSHHPGFNLFVQSFLFAPLFLRDFESSVRPVLNTLTFMFVEYSPSEDGTAM